MYQHQHQIQHQNSADTTKEQAEEDTTKDWLYPALTSGMMINTKMTIVAYLLPFQASPPMPGPDPTPAWLQIGVQRTP